VRVRRDREFNVADLLRYKGYDVFLPQYRCLRRAARQLKECDAALFPGYLFCSIRPGVAGGVLTTPGVMAFVSNGRTPVEMDPAEIRSLHLAVSKCCVQPWPFVSSGQRIRIDRGALEGLEGIVIRVKNQYRLVISVTMLQRSAVIEIDSHMVTPLDGGHSPYLETSVASSAFEWHDEGVVMGDTP
jgi:transcription antitermination factor NusG